MIDVEEVKRKIISYLETEGPNLPVRIAKRVELSPVFSSAILSELVQDRKIKMSNLRVGSSPLYLIPGDEKRLEDFTDNLSGVEKTAFLKLKNSLVLEDEKQEPSIRVALRAIKDFASPIKFQDKIFWKYSFSSNEDINKILRPAIKKEVPIQEKTIPNENPPQKKISENKPTEIEKPILEIKVKSKKVKKTPEEFLNEVKDFLERKDIELLETSEVKKKQIIGKVRINSDLGKIILLLIAKDKKRPSLADLTTAMKETSHEKMPCYFISKGEPASTTKDFIEENKNLLKTDILEQ
jgi:hypothetical protein